MQFFDRPWTAAQLGTHAANEFAMHRWDMIGDDETGDVLMAAPQVTESAFQTLNTLPMLDEAPSARVARSGLSDTRVVLRSPGHLDIALVAGQPGQAHLEMSAWPAAVRRRRRHHRRREPPPDTVGPAIGQQVDQHHWRPHPLAEGRQHPLGRRPRVVREHHW